MSGNWDARATLTIAELVSTWAQRKPNEPAVVDVSAATARTWTWRQLLTHGERIGASLRELGVQRGDVIAVQLPNWGEAVLAMLGILRIGATCCSLLSTLGLQDTRQAIRDTGARVVFTERRIADRLFLERHVEHVIVIDRDEAAHRPMRGVGPHLHSFEDWLAGDDVPAMPPVSCDRDEDPYGQLAFTSGTTGKAKCVLHRVSTLTTATRMLTERLGITKADRVFVACPLGHHSGFLYGMWLSLAHGCAQILLGEWDPWRALDELSRWRATFTQLAPALLIDLLNAIDAGHALPSTLRTCVVTGAAVPGWLVARANHMLDGASVLTAWGSTETCMGTLAGPDEPTGTDGTPLAGVSLRVTDDDGRVLDAGCEGRLEVCSPCLFPGYGREPEFDRSSFSFDGWYRTGDLATVDDSGSLRITGRIGDVINRGGEKIPVGAIEKVLSGHSSVTDIAITAMPDPRLGERACAFVVLVRGRDLSLADVQHYLKSRGVTKHYWPERLEIVPFLPRNEAGKVQKIVLRQWVEHTAASGVAGN